MSSEAANVEGRGLQHTPREVILWLKTIFENIPAFSVSEKNIEILTKIKRASEISTRNASIIVEDQRKKGEEYNAEYERIHTITSHMEIIPENLTKKGQIMVRNVALAGCALHLQKPTETSFLLALIELNRETNRVQAERKQMETMSKRVVNATYSTWVKFQKFRNLHQKISDEKKLRQEKIKELRKDTSFLKKKVKNYRNDLALLEEKYAQRGMEESLKHEVLQAEIESLREAKENLVRLKRELKGYRELPPDLEIANFKIEELKVQMEEINKQVLQMMPNLQ